MLTAGRGGDNRGRLFGILLSAGIFSGKENDVRLYDILDRVSCWCCKNKNRKELKAIYQYLPTTGHG